MHKHNLSPKEIQVVRLTEQGLTNKEIAEAMNPDFRNKKRKMVLNLKACSLASFLFVTH